MHIRLVAPGLFWPTSPLSTTSIPGLDSVELPSLAWLLARSHETGQTEADAARAFSRALALDAGAAALRAAGEPGSPCPRPGENWLCADPVNLSFAGEHLVLNPAQALKITQEEAQDLERLMRATLAGHGEFHMASPERGYLRLTTASRIRFAPLIDAAGRPLSYFLPEGEDEREWLRIAGEVEIALHESALNARREESGLPAINRLWFWGQGATPEPAAAPRPLVVADSLSGHGAAKLAGSFALPLARLGEALNSGADELVILIEELEQPVLYSDCEAWLAALLSLEARLFAPLRDVLRRRGVRLEISAPLRAGGPELAIASRRFAFWRRPAPLSRQLIRT
ncbi:hypothetical protein [Niveibacterium terrae]|uniref:hypothetical protein n=1 Tax=Niveibacterium terrae TaxID=3373598 RepID=UPI003A8D9716